MEKEGTLPPGRLRWGLRGRGRDRWGAARGDDGRGEVPRAEYGGVGVGRTAGKGRTGIQG